MQSRGRAQVQKPANKKPNQDGDMDSDEDMMGGGGFMPRRNKVQNFEYYKDFEDDLDEEKDFK